MEKAAPEVGVGAYRRRFGRSKIMFKLNVTGVAEKKKKRNSIGLSCSRGENRRRIEAKEQEKEEDDEDEEDDGEEDEDEDEEELVVDVDADVDVRVDRVVNDVSFENAGVFREGCVRSRRGRGHFRFFRENELEKKNRKWKDVAVEEGKGRVAYHR